MGTESTTSPSDEALLQRMIDSMLDPVFVKDREHRWIAFNAAFCRLLGRSREALLGRSDPDFFPADQVEVFWRGDDELFAADAPFEQEEQLTTASGEVRTIWTRKYPLREGDRVVGLTGIIADITVLRARLTAEREAMIRAQEATILRMAAPVLQIWTGTLLVPLIGELTPRRAELVRAQLLDEIARTRARRVLLDITGVPGLDAAGAAELARAVQAARLLGAEAALVGIGPALARALVAMDLAFPGVAIFATLEDGLRTLMRR